MQIQTDRPIHRISTCKHSRQKKVMQTDMEADRQTYVPSGQTVSFLADIMWKGPPLKLGIDTGSFSRAAILMSTRPSWFVCRLRNTRTHVPLPWKHKATVISTLLSPPLGGHKHPQTPRYHGEKRCLVHCYSLLSVATNTSHTLLPWEKNGN